MKIVLVNGGNDPRKKLNGTTIIDGVMYQYNFDSDLEKEKWERDLRDNNFRKEVEKARQKELEEWNKNIKQKKQEKDISKKDNLKMLQEYIELGGSYNGSVSKYNVEARRYCKEMGIKFIEKDYYHLKSSFVNAIYPRIGTDTTDFISWIDFYSWSINKYQPGLRLKRKVKNDKYTSDNLYWVNESKKKKL